MAVIFNGTTQYLSKASAIISAVPLSIAGWVNSTSFLNGPICFGIADGVGNNDFLVWWSAGGGAQQPTAEEKSAGSAVGAGPGAFVATGVWAQITAVFASATSQALYVNGGTANTNGTGTAPVSLSVSGVGSTGTSATPWNGSMAFVAFWNVALSAADAASLAAGFSPKKIRPDKLVSYVRGDAANGFDYCSTTLWTLNGAPGVGTNPPVYLP